MSLFFNSFWVAISIFPQHKFSIVLSLIIPNSSGENPLSTRLLDYPISGYLTPPPPFQQNQPPSSSSSDNNAAAQAVNNAISNMQQLLAQQQHMSKLELQLSQGM